MNASEIFAIIETSDLGFFGLRKIPEDQTGTFSVGDILPDSYDWIDGVINLESPLNGTCAIGITDDIDEIGLALDALNTYSGNEIALVGDTRQSYGQDDGEVIMPRATVLAIFEK